MAVAISGQKYYADSASISESLSELNFASLGGNTINTVNAKAPEGSIELSFYITTGNEITNITNQYGKTGFQEVKVGPFTAEKSLLQSFGVQVDPVGVLRGSLNYAYYGQLTSGVGAAPSGATIIPAHGAASTVGVTDVGVTSAVGFSYDFSQSFDVAFSIGSSAPARVTFQEMAKELSIDAQAHDTSFSQSALTGSSGICHNASGEAGFSVKTGVLVLKNLCQESIGELGVTGYLETRSFSMEANQNVQQSLSIKEVSVAGEC